MCLWIPHLFPFEDTDSKGLPLILDRERCSFTVRLQPLSENDGINATAAVTTAQGVLLAHESPESYNPDFTRYFNEFSFSNKLLLADEVTYPEKRWNTLEEYYRDNMMHSLSQMNGKNENQQMLQDKHLVKYGYRLIAFGVV